MAEIILKSGEVVLVDDADYPWLSHWKWKRHRNGYACRTGYKNKKYILVLMHRQIMEPPYGLEVDHINRNKLDNRRVNLRCVTRSENNFNRPAQSNNRSGGHKGVCLDRGRMLWKAAYGKVLLGRFSTFDEAVNARREAELLADRSNEGSDR